MIPSQNPIGSRTFRATALALSVALFTSGCTTVHDFAASHSESVNCITGGAIGAVAGAAAGAMVKKNKKEKGNGSIIGGALIGATAGCGIALVYKNRIDKLEKVAKEENLRLQTETLKTAEPGAAPEDAGFVAQVEDQGMFPLGSAALTADGQRQVRKLASAFASKPGEKDTTAILVVGHTDATGSAATNQKLSEQRARAVASILAEQGISADRMYFQGAGASRPVADNTDVTERAKNRRVEIVEVNDVQTLVKRINAEQNNPKYLAHGTSTTAPAAPAQGKATASSGKTASGKNTSVAKSGSDKSATTVAKTGTDKTSTTVAKTDTSKDTSSESTAQSPVVTSTQGKSSEVASAKAPASSASPFKGTAVDFGGKPASTNQWTLGQAITPKSGGFALISSAQASQIPMSSCEADQPRESGKVFNLASGRAVENRATTDYLPGYNNRVWAETVNGHLVTISPVSILRESAAVDRQPFIQVVENYDKGNRKALSKVNAVANTYEGQDRVLYRVFIQNPKAPLSCMDVVFSKGNSQATDGVLFYPKSSGETYSARYVPTRT